MYANDFKDTNQIKNFRTLSLGLSVFVLVIYFLMMGMFADSLNDIVALVMNNIVIWLVCVFIVHTKKLSKNWKILLTILIVIYLLYNLFLGATYGIAPKGDMFLIFYYLKFSLVIYSLASLCILFDRFYKISDILCMVDYIFAFGALVFSACLGNILFFLHFLLFHIIVALIFLSFNADKGYTQVLVYDTVLGNLSRQLFALIVVSSTGLTIIFCILKVLNNTFITSNFLMNAFIIFFAIMWLFLFYFTSKVNIADVEQRINLIQSDKTNKTLLAEVHHRVKNNLGVIVSFTNLKKRKIKDQQSIDILTDVQNRIMAMALVHSNLYETLDFGKVSAKKYIKELLDNINSSIESEDIHLDLDIADVFIILDIIIPLGMVINECVLNSLKYAFPENKGKIIIYLKELDANKLELIVGDNGVGCSEECLNSADGIGTTVINALVSQIDGELTYDFTDGFKRKIIFENKEEN